MKKIFKRNFLTRLIKFNFYFSFERTRVRPPWHILICLASCAPLINESNEIPQNLRLSTSISALISLSARLNLAATVSDSVWKLCSLLTLKTAVNLTQTNRHDIILLREISQAVFA